MKTETKKELIYADECYQVMGIVFRVFNKLGYGHKEAIYQKALKQDFLANEMEFKEQLRCKVRYKNEEIGIYIFDFLLFGKIILEIKQRNFISLKDINQLYKYLRVANLRLGIIITFTPDGVKYKRVVNL